MGDQKIALLFENPVNSNRFFTEAIQPKALPLTPGKLVMNHFICFLGVPLYFGRGVALPYAIRSQLVKDHASW
jgi:hypothetical protein